MSLDKIYKQLSMNAGNGLCVLSDNNCKNFLPKRFSFLITEKLKPESFFCFDGKPLVLFYDRPKDKTELLKKIWNFNESPIVIINEPDAVEIYNGLSYLKNEKTLAKLKVNLNAFSYFELITGRFLEKYKDGFKKEGRVDRTLLNNIKVAREILIQQHDVSADIANALIGKCIFVRYLIDRKVTLKYEEIDSNQSFCQLLDDKKKLIKFFKYLQKKFNGEAFLLNDDELNNVPQEAFNTLKRLLEGVEISSGQQSLFDIYDFSIIPIEFISNVYESFMGEEKQKGGSAYYTPKFLVDYILSETVEKKLKKQSKYSCKVLDPACGSGIFLVEALRRVIEKYQDLHGEAITEKDLKQLAKDNIYGIDKDENAINVAIFSIYLALLDYQSPKNIENFTFPNLRTNGNFHIADFFDTNAEYNKKFEKLEFDFIIGNPPWKRGGDDKSLFVKYIKNRDGAVISNREIAQAFLLRTSDFSSQDTKCALIVSSKVLYNLNAKQFRTYFLKNYLIRRVFELAPVASEIFDSANAPAAILFFKYAHKDNTKSNLIEHFCLKPSRFFSLFRIFTLQKPDIKTVVQKRLIEYDWLWKVLVYGSYLDFNFLKRLKNDYKIIGDIIPRDNRRQGVMCHRGDANNSSHLIGRKLIKTHHVERFSISNDLDIFEKTHIHRPGNPELFSGYALLIKEGLNNDFEFISAIKKDDSVFISSFSAIKARYDILKILHGLFNSTLYTYNILQTGSCTGVDRDQVHDKEKWCLSYTENPKIAEAVEKIEEIVKKTSNKILESPQTEKKDILIKSLNNEVFKSFDLSTQEKDLVDYAIDITIPRIKKHNGYEQIFSPINFKNKSLADYIGIYFSRFEKSFGDDKYLKAEIWHTQYILGVFFKVTSESDQLIKWHKKDDDNFLAKISKLGIKEVSEDLFIQKDIRGFEADGFYIIKPNEKNLWHKAMAHIDSDDFMDAILKTGKKKYNE